MSVTPFIDARTPPNVIVPSSVQALEEDVGAALEMGQRVAHADDRAGAVRRREPGQVAQVGAHGVDHELALAVVQLVQQRLAGVDGDHRREAQLRRATAW